MARDSMIRSTAQRIADTIHRLDTDDDVWVATASPEGQPHLVPLSLAWLDSRVMCVTPSHAPTARNIAATSVARCSLESTTDVVVMRSDAEIVDLAECDQGVVQRMVERFGWDPRQSPDTPWSVLIMTPQMIHAWRMEPEIGGRTIMRRGQWVV